MSKFGPSLVAELPQQTGNENLVSHVLFVFILNFAWILNFQWLLFFTLKHRSIYKRENSQLSHQWLRGYALPTLRKHNSPSILRKWIFLLETVTLKRKLISGKNIQGFMSKNFYEEIHILFWFILKICVCVGGVFASECRSWVLLGLGLQAVVNCLVWVMALNAGLLEK